MIALAIIGCIVFVPLSALWEGWVLSVLWTWFVVPLGAPILSVPAAIGMGLVVSLLTAKVRKLDVEWSDIIVQATLGPLIFLTVGWVVHQWV